MKQLALIFNNEAGKEVSLKPSVTRDDLTAEEVRTVMDGIVALEMFKHQGDLRYHSVKGAKYVETIVTELF